MRRVVLPVTLLLLAALPAAAQLSDTELRSDLARAEADPTLENLLDATYAARMMRDYDQAAEQLESAWETANPLINNLVGETLMHELASGGGIAGLQRAFRGIREGFNFSPIQISTWAGNFPEILASGEFDEMAMRFSPEAEDPQHRCGCYNTVAWVHRLAGRHDEARAIWATLVEGEPANLNSENLNQSAQIRGQYARNLARAGRVDEARRQLRMSMDTEVSAGALPAVRRRWAQAYAELGDVQGTIEHLEPLLEANSLITVHTLESRAAWMLVRDDPAFQALLDRYR